MFNGETKTNSKVPLTIEEMRDIRFIIDTMQRNLSAETKSKLGRDIEWALYTLDHAMECPVEADEPSHIPHAWPALG